MYNGVKVNEKCAGADEKTVGSSSDPLLPLNVCVVMHSYKSGLNIMSYTIVLDQIFLHRLVFISPVQFRSCQFVTKTSTNNNT